MYAMGTWDGNSTMVLRVMDVVTLGPPRLEVAGDFDASLAEAADKTVMGPLARLSLRSRRRRGERLAGRSRATDSSRERPLVNQSASQEARGRTSTGILSDAC